MGNTANAHVAKEQWPAISTETAKEYDYILLVDKSGSMGSPSTKMEGRTRWQEAQEFTEQFARFASTVDDDGITVIKFSSSPTVWDGVTADKVHELFTTGQPGGGTNLAAALEEAWKKKWSSSKKAVIVCVTDGEPDSESAVIKSITDAAAKAENASHLNLLFVQIGEDPSAAKFLDNLDNGLSSAKYDIVNTLSAEDAGALTMEQLVYQAVNH